MLLFWRHGYEGVTVAELSTAIGVAPPSLYAAFRSKAGLYQLALSRYEETLGRVEIAKIQAAGSLPAAVRLLLEVSVATVTHREHERGCMISSGLVACHPDHEALASDAAARRETLRIRIEEALSCFVEGGQLRRLARLLTAVMQGISIQARDGIVMQELRDIVDDVVAGLSALAGSTRKPSPDEIGNDL